MSPTDGSPKKVRTSLLNRMIQSFALPRARLNPKGFASEVICDIRLYDASVLCIPPTPPNPCPILSLHKSHLPMDEHPAGKPPIEHKLIVFFPGNDMDVANILSDMTLLVRLLNCSVISLTYPDYDLAKIVAQYLPIRCHTEEESRRMDMAILHGRDLLLYLLEKTELKPSDIILIGFSIGTGVLSNNLRELHETRDIAFPLVSLHSPFSNFNEVAAALTLRQLGLTPKHSLFTSIVKIIEEDCRDWSHQWDTLNNLKVVSQRTTIFLYHAPSDNIVPLCLGGQKIAEELKLPAERCVFDPMSMKHALLTSVTEMKNFVQSIETMIQSGIRGPAISRVANSLGTLLTLDLSKSLNSVIFNKEVFIVPPAVQPVILSPDEH